MYHKNTSEEAMMLLLSFKKGMILLVMLALIGCQAQVESEPEATAVGQILPTVADMETAVLPTNTPIPATATATATFVPPTNTPTVTPTETPLPSPTPVFITDIATMAGKYYASFNMGGGLLAKFYFLFLVDGTYYFSNVDTFTDHSIGTYWFDEEGLMHLTGDSSLWQPCDAEAVGKYRVQLLSATTIRFRYGGDPCYDAPGLSRYEILAREYERLE
jgi:hypothetical protein